VSVGGLQPWQKAPPKLYSPDSAAAAALLAPQQLQRGHGSAESNSSQPATPLAPGTSR
jgi:hypothetical protein